MAAYMYFSESYFFPEIHRHFAIEINHKTTVNSRYTSGYDLIAANAGNSLLMESFRIYSNHII